MPSTLDVIVSLQTTLNELSDADQRLHSIPGWMSELHEEHTQRQAEIDAVAAEAEAADQERREAEAEAGDAGEKQKQYQRQMGKISSTREYKALLKEIDNVKEKIRKAEHKALEAMERNEQLLAKKQQMEEDFRELDERYQAELGRWESEKPTVAAAIEELKGRSAELRAEVPRPALTLFDRIYERYDGQALARVRRMELVQGDAMWHCDACSFNVRPQTVVEIKNASKLNQCESCKRILYWEEDG